MTKLGLDPALFREQRHCRPCELFSRRPLLPNLVPCDGRHRLKVKLFQMQRATPVETQQNVIACLDVNKGDDGLARQVALVVEQQFWVVPANTIEPSQAASGKRNPTRTGAATGSRVQMRG